MSAALIGSGESFPYTPSIDIAKGTIVKEGAVVGMVNLSILANQQGTILVGGFYSIPRKSGAVFAIGDRVYCDLSADPQEATDDDTKEYIGTYVEDNPISSDWIHFVMNASFRENTAPSGGGSWGTITGDIEDQTDLIALFDSLEDIEFTQPSASDTWVLNHGRTIKPNIAYYNAAGDREYPDEATTGVGQTTVSFATSEVHTATLPGNGTSASLRKENILSILASEINTALGVLDIATYGGFEIEMDTDITSAITFSSTPSGETSLELTFIQGAVPKTSVPPDTNKFKGSTSNPIPSPLLTATANAEDRFSFRYSTAKTKMNLTGSDLGG